MIGDQIFLTVVAGMVMLLPGIPWLVFLRLDRRAIPVELVPGVLLVLTLAAATAAEVVALTFDLPLKWQFGLMCVVACLPFPLLLRRRAAALRSFETWSIDLPAMVVGAVTAAMAVVSFIVGGQLSADSLYHVSVSVKLQSLAHPNFSNIQSFVDGGPHPGYAVPALHALMAFVASISGFHPSTVMLISPAVLTPIALLTIAGSSVVLFRTRLAAPVAGLAFVLLLLETQSYVYSIFQGGYPREVATAVAMPLALAAWLVAIRAPDWRSAARACALMGVSIITLVVLHVSYIFLLVIWFAGYLLFWLVFGSVREEFKRHVLVSLVAFVVAVAAVAPLLPTLSTLQAFAQSTTVEQVMVDDALPLQPAGLKFGQLFIGNEHGYHLRPDYVVWRGGLFMLGALAAAAAAFRPRRRESMVLAGTMFVVLLTTLSDTLFPLLVQATGTSQARRIFLAVPAAWGLTMLVLSVAIGMAWLQTRRRGVLRRAGQAALAAGLVSAAFVSSRIQIERDVLHPNIPGWTLYVAFAVVAGALLFGVAARVWRLLVSAEPAPDRSAASVTPGHLGRWTMVASTCLVIGAWPLVARGADSISSRMSARDWRSGPMHAGLDPNGMGDVLFRHGLSKGSVVLAPSDLSYRLKAAVPVYVVGSIPGHDANTKLNRVYERYQALLDFYQVGASPERRLKIINDEHADVVVVVDPKIARRIAARAVAKGNALPLYDQQPDPALLALVQNDRKLFQPVGHVRQYLVYRVNRKALQ